MAPNTLQRQTNEYHVLNGVLNACKANPGSTRELELGISQIQLRLRKSRCLRSTPDGNDYETLDIVTFGYIPFLEHQMTLEQMPKNVFKPTLALILEWCRENGLSLFIENILSDKLYDHYVGIGFEPTTQPKCLIKRWANL